MRHIYGVELAENVCLGHVETACTLALDFLYLLCLWMPPAERQDGVGLGGAGPLEGHVGLLVRWAAELGRGTEAAGLRPRRLGLGTGPRELGMPESLMTIAQDLMLASAPVYARNWRLVRDSRVESGVDGRVESGMDGRDESGGDGRGRAEGAVTGLRTPGKTYLTPGMPESVMEVAQDFLMSPTPV